MLELAVKIITYMIYSNDINTLYPLSVQFEQISHTETTVRAQIDQPLFIPAVFNRSNTIHAYDTILDDAGKKHCRRAANKVCLW